MRHLVAYLLASGLVLGCSVSEVGSMDPDAGAPECESGDTKLGAGGCYRCACDDSGHWDCPDIDCDPPEPCTPGESYPVGDGCNTCTCRPDGALACTTTDCQNTCAPGTADCDGDPANGCETDVTSDVMNCGACGVVCPTAPDGTASCLDGDCEIFDGGSCTYQGVDHPIGESFRARDGCNECICEATDTGTGVLCTDVACICDPAAEAHYRNYVSTGSCLTVDYVCPDYTRMFMNDCGCGCEQGTECPDTFTCPSDGSMDATCDDLRTRCPWTELIAP